MPTKTDTDRSSGADTILALEAFEHVHNDQLARYLHMGQLIDDLVRQTEPGMLVHALTKSSANDSETVFRWLEVFENAEALEKHLDNPHVIAHIEKLSQGVLCDTTELVIYANWSDELKDYWKNKLSGANVSFPDLESGFFIGR